MPREPPSWPSRVAPAGRASRSDATWDHVSPLFPPKLALPTCKGQPLQGQDTCMPRTGVWPWAMAGWHGGRTRWKWAVPGLWKDVSPVHQVPT